MYRTVFLFLFSLHYILNTYGQSDYIIFSDKNYEGLKDINQEVLIPAGHNKIGWSEGLQIPVGDVIGYRDKHWGLISVNNKPITKPHYYHLWAFHKDLIIASIKGKFSNHIFYGAINSKGKAIIEFKYSSVKKTGNSLIITEERNGMIYFGLINEKNELLLDVEYSDITHFSNDLFVFSTQKNKKGIIRSNGKILIQPTLDSIAIPKSQRAHIFKGGMQGLIDLSGSILIKPENKSIHVNDDGTLDLAKFQQWSVLNSENENQKTFHCDSILALPNDGYLVYKNNNLQVYNGSFESVYAATNSSLISTLEDKIVLSQHHKYGVIDVLGNIFIPFKYDSIYVTSNYFFLKKKNKWSIHNKFGRKISKHPYNAVKPDTENMIAVKRKGYWGFIDFQGDETIPLKFDDVFPFKDRIAKVSYLNSQGSVNHFGEWVCEPIYDKVKITSEGISVGKVKRRIDLIGETGNVIFQTYNHLKPHGVGFMEYTDEGLKGLVSKSGKIYLYPEFDYISEVLTGGKIFVKKGELSGVISSTGEWEFYLSNRYNSFLGLHDEYYGVEIDGKYGFVDRQERLRIANRYDSISLFYNGMAAIKLRDKWGFIDKEEKLTVQPHYDRLSNFSKRFAIVSEHDKYGIISKERNFILPIAYDSIAKQSFNGFLIKKDNKYGWLNAEGKIIIPAEYDRLQVISDRLFIVKRRGKYGLLNESGLFSIPLLYDDIIHSRDDSFFCITNGENKQVSLQ